MVDTHYLVIDQHDEGYHLRHAAQPPAEGTNGDGGKKRRPRRPPLASPYNVGTDQASELMGVAPRTVAQYRKLPPSNPKHLPGVRLNRRWWFRREDIDAWIRRNTS